MMRPRQLCQQRCHFLLPPVRLDELSHPEQVAARIATHTGVLASNGRCELVDDAVAPLSALDLFADVLTDLPIQGHELRVDRLVRAATGCIDEHENLIELLGRSDRTRGRLSGQRRDVLPSRNCWLRAARPCHRPPIPATAYTVDFMFWALPAAREYTNSSAEQPGRESEVSNTRNARPASGAADPGVAFTSSPRT